MKVSPPVLSVVEGVFYQVLPLLSTSPLQLLGVLSRPRQDLVLLLPASEAEGSWTSGVVAPPVPAGLRLLAASAMGFLTFGAYLPPPACS